MWSQRASALLVGFVLLLAFPAAGVGPPAPPARYSCVIETDVFQGRSVSDLRLVEKRIERVWHQDQAYRIEIETRRFRPGSPPGNARPVAFEPTIRLNNGDGSGTEFLFSPARRRAQLSLPTVQLLFSRKYPERWKAEFGGHAAEVSGNLLRTVEVPGAPGQRGRMQGSTWEVAARSERIDGKVCRVVVQKWNELVDPRTLRRDPNTRHATRQWVWVNGNVVLREERLSEFLGDRRPRPLVARHVTVVRDLKLDPPIPASSFELPPGTVCTVFSDYPVRLPKGVERRTLPGAGLQRDLPAPGGAVR